MPTFEYNALLKYILNNALLLIYLARGHIGANYPKLRSGLLKYLYLRFISLIFSVRFRPGIKITTITICLVFYIILNSSMLILKLNK